LRSTSSIGRSPGGEPHLALRLTVLQAALGAAGRLAGAPLRGPGGLAEHAAAAAGLSWLAVVASYWHWPPLPARLAQLSGRGSWSAASWCFSRPSRSGAGRKTLTVDIADRPVAGGLLHGAGGAEAWSLSPRLEAPSEGVRREHNPDQIESSPPVGRPDPPRPRITEARPHCGSHALSSSRCSPSLAARRAMCPRGLCAHLMEPGCCCFTPRPVRCRNNGRGGTALHPVPVDRLFLFILTCNLLGLVPGGHATAICRSRRRSPYQLSW